MRCVFVLVLCVGWQSASVAATFVGEAQAKFRVTEYLGGTSGAVEHIAPISFVLETDYTQVEWSIRYDVDLLMAGGPDMPSETRLKAKGYLKAVPHAPSLLTFPGVNGYIAAGRYDLYGMAEWSLLERIADTTAFYESGQNPTGGPQHIQGVSLAEYPDSLELDHNIRPDEWLTDLGQINLRPDNIIKAEIIGVHPLATLKLRPLLPGDFTSDGTVDAADYVLWRKGPGVAALLTSYDTWRDNFGSQLAPVNALTEAVQAPEPTMLALALIACLPLATSRLRG